MTNNLRLGLREQPAADVLGRGTQALIADLLAVGVGNVGADWAEKVARNLPRIHSQRTGDFDVVEGPVTKFEPYTPTRRRETFAVNGIAFTYSDRALGDGGFRYSFGADGNLRVGMNVRAAHREGRILKLEIREE